MRQGRIILADKHSNMLGGIRRLLEDVVETVLMVTDETSLNHALENFNPDVVVVDLSLPTSNGNKHCLGAQEKLSQNKSHYPERP